MNPSSIVVSVKMDKELFRDFAIFDTFQHKRRWQMPVLFALIMSGFATVCFCMYQKADQAIFMGVILMTIGLGLPIVYFTKFFASINTEIRRLNLERPKPVYDVTLSDSLEGIRVVAKNGAAAGYLWEEIHGVYRKKGCTYLYTGVNQAYLLPDRDVAENKSVLEDLIQKWAPAKA